MVNYRTELLILTTAHRCRMNYSWAESTHHSPHALLVNYSCSLVLTSPHARCSG